MLARSKRLDALDVRLDRMSSEIERLTAVVAKLASAPAPAPMPSPVPVQPPDRDLVARLLESVEKLSSRFYDAWVDERQRAREQRRQAARKSAEIRDAEVAAKEAFEKAQMQLPRPFDDCEECAAIAEGRQPKHARDMVRHALEKHKVEVSNGVTIANRTLAS